MNSGAAAAFGAGGAFFAGAAAFAGFAGALASGAGACASAPAASATPAASASARVVILPTFIDASGPRAVARPHQGTIPHSNILLTTGPAILSKNAWRICRVVP